MIKPVLRSTSAFMADRSGNFAIITALLMVPLVGMSGLAADHLAASSAKQRIDTAADAAALAAINTARRLSQGNANWGTGNVIPEARAAAQRAFAANLRDTGRTTVGAPNIQVTRNNDTFTARIGWSATTQSYFGGIFNVSSHQLTGAAEATASLALYTNIHVVMDYSASMLIGATPADHQRSFDLGNKINPGMNCAFLCHMPRNASEQPTYPALKGQVTLRVDVMRSALMSAIADLQRSQTIADQYRIGVYGFSSEVREFLAASDARATDLSHVRNVVNATDPWNASGGGTKYGNLFSRLDRVIPAAGAGLTPAQPRQAVILVTDGVEDAIRYAPGGLKSWYDASVPIFAPSYPGPKFQNLNPAYCDALKSRGVQIIVVRVRYVVPSMHNGWPQFQFIRNTLEPLMANTLGRCATSPANYVVADTPDEIRRAIEAAFSMVAPLRLTN